MSRKTILVVDDDADLRLALKIRLSANGYEVMFAGDGKESVSAAKEHRPDLILLDLGLPSGDGYSVMESLKLDRTTALIPVIVLSARDRLPNWNRALQVGAYAFLQKPAETSELLGLVRRALGEKQKKVAAEADLIVGSEPTAAPERETMMSRILGGRAV